MGTKKRMKKLQRSIAALQAAVGSSPLGSRDPGRPASDTGRDAFGQAKPGTSATPPANAQRTSADSLFPKGAAGGVLFKARKTKVKAAKVRPETLMQKALREEDPQLRKGYMQLAEEAGETTRSRSQWTADAVELERRAAIEEDPALRSGYRALAIEAREQAAR